MIEEISEDESVKEMKNEIEKSLELLYLKVKEFVRKKQLQIAKQQKQALEKQTTTRGQRETRKIIERRKNNVLTREALEKGMFNFDLLTKKSFSISFSPIIPTYLFFSNS